MRAPRKELVVREDEHTYWASKFDVTEATLRNAIDAVGPGLDDVERYLDALKHGANGEQHPLHDHS
jgi:hypothetical protein